jgi:Tfp pilus assembly protein FimT
MKIGATPGFTIVELIVIISIICIMSCFAYVGMDLIRREHVLSVNRQLLADLYSARMNAMTQGGKGFGIRFVSPTSYALFKFNDCNNDNTYDTNTCGGNSREETNVVTKTLSPSIAISKTNPSNHMNNEILIFDRHGFPRQANWGMGLMTILVSHNSHPEFIKCVTISLNRIRETTWNGSKCI